MEVPILIRLKYICNISCKNMYHINKEKVISLLPYASCWSRSGKNLTKLYREKSNLPHL